MRISFHFNDRCKSETLKSRCFPVTTHHSPFDIFPKCSKNIRLKVRTAFIFGHITHSHDHYRLNLWRRTILSNNAKINESKMSFFCSHSQHFFTTAHMRMIIGNPIHSENSRYKFAFVISIFRCMTKRFRRFSHPGRLEITREIVFLFSAKSHGISFSELISLRNRTTVDGEFMGIGRS